MEGLIAFLLVPTFYLGIVVGIHWNDDDEIRNNHLLCRKPADYKVKYDFYQLERQK